MKRKTTVLILIASIALLSCGCGNENATEENMKAVALIQKKDSETEPIQEEEPTAEEIVEEELIEDAEKVLERDVEETEDTEESEEETSEEEKQTDNEESGEDDKIIYDESYVFPEFSFDDLKYSEFCFSSGVGGWATLLTVSADGSFSGEYSDGDLGVTGENYPNGTVYQCVFNGQFTEPVKINDYTYSVQISELYYEHEEGTEEIIDGQRYIYTDVYGFDDAENILIYLPGAPMEKLPEEFRSWLYTSDTALQYYALNNEAWQQGFRSYNIIENLKEDVSLTEYIVHYYEDSIKNDSLTSSEINEKTREIYEWWDYSLNDVWKVLKQTKDDETMGALTAEERQWITMKEQAVAEIGKEYTNKTMQEIAMNRKAAELTKERVYELMELFE